MNTTTRLLTLAAALLVAASASEAQGSKRTLRGSGVRADSARREAARQRIASLSPEQKAKLETRRESMRAEREVIASKVRSGQITRAQARAEMQVLQKRHRSRAPRGIR